MQEDPSNDSDTGEAASEGGAGDGASAAPSSGVPHGEDPFPEDPELDALLAEMDEADRDEAHARTLAELAAVEDDRLKGFKRDWLYDEEVALDDLGRCRDLMRLMVQGLAGDATRWPLLRSAHAAAFGGEREVPPGPMPTAPRRSVGEVDSSPWVKASAAAPPRPAAPAPAPPPSGATPPAPVPAAAPAAAAAAVARAATGLPGRHAPLGGTAMAPPAKGGTALPFRSGARAAPRTPQPLGDKLAPHPAMGRTVGLPGAGAASKGAAAELSLPEYVAVVYELQRTAHDVAAVVRKYGLDEAAWKQQHARFQQQLAASPELKQQHDALLAKLGGD